MSEQEELKLACLHQAGGNLDHAKALFDWVSGSVRATPDSEAAEVSAPKQDKPQQPFNYQHPSKYGTDVPRRCYLEELTPEERAIRDLVDTVERLGAHPLLTATVIQLMKAGEDLADWVDIGLRDKDIAALSPGNDLGLLDDGQQETSPVQSASDQDKAELPEGFLPWKVDWTEEDRGQRIVLLFEDGEQYETAFGDGSGGRSLRKAIIGYKPITVSVAQPPSPDLLLENQPGVSSQASSGEAATLEDELDRLANEGLRSDGWIPEGEFEFPAQEAIVEVRWNDGYCERVKFGGYTQTTNEPFWTSPRREDEDDDADWHVTHYRSYPLADDAKVGEVVSGLDSQEIQQHTNEQELKDEGLPVLDAGNTVFQDQTEAAIVDKDEPDPAPYAPINAEEPAGDAAVFARGMMEEAEADAEIQKFNPFRLFRQKEPA